MISKALKVRGRKRLPQDEKVRNDGLLPRQDRRIVAEAKKMNVTRAQYLRNIVDWHFDQLDTSRDGSLREKKEDDE